MLRKNDFLFSKLGMEHSEEDLILQSELLCKPMYRVHDDLMEFEVSGEKGHDQIDHTHSLKDLASQNATGDKIFSHEVPQKIELDITNSKFLHVSIQRHEIVEGDSSRLIL